MLRSERVMLFISPKLVELDDGFGQVEVDRSAAVALAVENLREVAHEFEMSRPAERSGARCDCVAFEHGVDCGVGHALSGADHAFAQIVADDFALVIDFHDAGEHEAVDVRTQAANVGGEFERQHGHGAVGKVDAGAAQAGFLIERGVGRDVLRDIGDVHL